MRSLLRQVLAPRCPACGKGKLFKDILGIVDACASCALPLKHHDAGDGPVFFAICLIGLLIVGGATFVELRYMPPMWLHAVLWLPLTFIGCIATLRMFKTILITMEYRLNQLRTKDPHA
jgi:uncharacterized protein (DUF983 family)